MIAMLMREGLEEDLALIAWYIAYNGSNTTKHSVKDDTMKSESRSMMKLAIETAGFES